MRVSVTPLVIDTLGTIPKGLIRRLVKLGIEERAENIQTKGKVEDC